MKGLTRIFLQVLFVTFSATLLADTCPTLVQAVAGTNHVPASATTEYWYTFTMPDADNKKLVITSATNKTIWIYTKDCPFMSAWAVSKGNISVANFAPLTRVSIKWELAGSGDFDWNLAVEDIEDGDSYNTPAQAIVGTNHVPANPSYPYWYKFKMPDLAGKKLVITSSTTANLNVLTDKRYYILGDYGLGSFEFSTLTPNQEVFIAWFSIDGGNFDFDVAIEDIEAGDNCSLAVAAQEGSNILAADGASYWYSFTMPGNATGNRIKVTSSNGNRVMIATDCSEHYVSMGYNNVTANQIQPNQKVYIRWFNENSDLDFTWNLTIDNGGLGGNCLSATAAVEGTNNVTSPVGAGGYVKWYKYTMPNATGKKLVLTTSSTNASTLFYYSCDDLSWEGGNASIGLVATGPSPNQGLQPNQEVYIQWASVSPNNFSWNLSVEDIVAGDKCTSPVAAIIGSNDVPALPTRAKHWYSFQMPDKAKQKLEINSLLSGNSEPFSVYSGTCDNLKLITTGTSYKMITGLAANEKIFIVWGDTKAHFNFSLTVMNEEAGESCVNPAKARIGTNSSPTAPYWFTFTMPVNGNLTISSVGKTTTDTYLIVYSDCNTVLNQSDDFKALQSEVTLTDLAKGTTVLIQWEKFTPNFTSPSFSWDLSIQSTEKAQQIITFEEIPTKTTLDQPFHVSATSSSLMDVTLSTTDDEITLSGDLVTIVKPGSVTITAKQPGFSIYLPAQVDRTFCISPLKPFIKGSITDKGAQQLTSTVAANNQWFKDGVKIDGATSVDFIPTVSGSYTVAVIVQGCSSEPSDKVDVSVTGLETEVNTIRIYPNPIVDEFFVELNAEQFCKINVVDVLGRSISHTEGTGIIRMKTESWQAGNYIVQIQADNSFSYKKVVKK